MTEKKLSQLFGYNVIKSKPAITASYNAIMWQMTEMSRQKKQLRVVYLRRTPIGVVGCLWRFVN